jgi:hypothetical protein
VSDPITNDYGLVATLTNEQMLRGLTRLRKLNRRAKPMNGALGLLELVDMCGLTDVANEVRRENGLAPLGSSSRVHGGVRDSIGRLRSVTAPATPLGETCPSDEHSWIEENISTNETTGRKRCKLCRNRLKQSGGAQPKIPDAPLLCKCPDIQHVLTKETSATTYVTKSGKRLCKVGEQRRKKASQARRNARKAAETVPDPGLKPGERWCGCDEPKHILTPESSATTYVYANGKRRCRAARQRAQQQRHIAVRKGTAA